MPRIRSQKDLSAAVDELAGHQNELAQVTGKKQKKMNAITESFAKPITDLEASIQEVAQRILKYVLANREAVFGGTNKAVIDTGQLNTKNTPLKQVVPDANALIDALVEGEYADFIAVKKSAAIAPLKKAFQEDDLPQDIAALITFKTGEQLIITPAASGIKVTIPIEQEDGLKAAA